MQQALDAGVAAGGDRGKRQLDMRGGEIAVQDADQVDQRVMAARQAVEHAALVDVGFDHVDRRQEDQVLRALAPARRHGDANPAPHESGDEMPADKA